MAIDKDQARTVKLIYKLYLEGSSPYIIAKTLDFMNIPTPMKASKWHKETIVHILSNEKYIGDSYLQKTYTQDIISKKIIKNDGTKVPKYYVTNDHPAIIKKETFDEVQERLAKRKNNTSSLYQFSNKIHCALCNHVFFRIAYRNELYNGPIFMWACTNRYIYKGNCKNIKLYEAELEYACHQIIKSLLDKYDDVWQTVYEIIEKTITPKKRHLTIKRCLKSFEFPNDSTIELIMQKIIISDIVVKPDRTAMFHIINNDIIDYTFPKWSVINNEPKKPPKRKRKNHTV
jgi:hypothetical protein